MFWLETESIPYHETFNNRDGLKTVVMCMESKSKMLGIQMWCIETIYTIEKRNLILVHNKNKMNFSNIFGQNFHKGRNGPFPLGRFHCHSVDLKMPFATWRMQPWYNGYCTVYTVLANKPDMSLELSTGMAPGPKRSVSLFFVSFSQNNLIQLQSHTYKITFSENT